MSGAYYNEIDPYAAQWLRNLIDAGHIAGGDVDERPIQEVTADDIRKYTQCHFFAGIGGWALALRLAGWPDDRPVWSGSCPCQPFSCAGKQKAQQDERHLWPIWFKLIAEVHPSVVFGEQVAGAIAHGWLDDAFDDLEREGYETGAAVLPACSVGAPHKRDRLWFVGHAKGSPWEQPQNETNTSAGGRKSGDGPVCAGSSLADSKCQQLRTTRLRETFGAPSAVQGEKQKREWVWDDVGQRSEALADANQQGSQGRDGGIMQERAGQCTARSSSAYVPHSESGGRIEGCQNAGGLRQESGKVQERRGPSDGDSDGSFWDFEPAVGRVANGIPARAHKLRAYGNAIVPQVAAKFIKAVM
jgi:DNA (cytosine-5)-methyltransferase 1